VYVAYGARTRRGCDWLDSYAVGIVQLVAHEAGESILCREGLQRTVRK